MAELDAVDRRIVTRDVDGDGIKIGRDALRLRPKRQRREGEQTRAGADVSDVAEVRASALEAIEGFKAAAGRRVLPGPKGEARVDFEADAVQLGRPRRRVDIEPPSADRLQAGLAHRYPIGFAKLLHLRAPTAQARQRGKIVCAWRVVEIGVDQPFVGLRGIGLVGDENGRTLAAAKEVAWLRDGLGLRAVAGNRRAPAHFAFSLANRSSRLWESWSA